jgi:hypothetical protein
VARCGGNLKPILLAVLGLLAGCGEERPADVCLALRDLPNFEGRMVQGRLAVISAAPHGSFFESRCYRSKYSLVLLRNDDVASRDEYSAKLFGSLGTYDSKDPMVMDAIVKGVVMPTGKGGWGLHVKSLTEIRLIPARGSRYETAEEMSAR